MYKIYLILDCKGLKYVGFTVSSLGHRLAQHKSDKKTRGNYASKMLNLDNCKISILEECKEESESRLREKYWIQNTDCVNKYKYDFSYKLWWSNNKDKSKIYNDKKKEYYSNRKKYRNSWGTISNNCLLNISSELFI